MFLKPEFSFTELDKIANAKSDNDFAEEMIKEKRKLFKAMRSPKKTKDYLKTSIDKNTIKE